MDEYMIFAERLTTEMERQELSYRRLAEKMGITVTTLFRYAKGQRIPKATEIVKASKTLGVTCDYLIGLSDDPHKTSTESVYHPVSVNTDLISRKQAVDAIFSEPLYKSGMKKRDADAVVPAIYEKIKSLPSAQPELIEKEAYIRGFEQGRTQGMIDTTTDGSNVVKKGGNDEDRTTDDLIGMDKLISLQQAFDALHCRFADGFEEDRWWNSTHVIAALKGLPAVQPDLGKYEYHYDHTDCIWYRPEARNRCPVTCAQYRDGWNDAMNYIFRDGKGYRPYRRGEQYEE